MAECMETAEIVRKILENFSGFQLLKLSLVNKVWNYEARSLLKERGDLIAKTQDLDSSCQHLREMALDFEKMNVVPFRGIRINLVSGMCPYRYVGTVGEQERIYETIFRRVQFKHLSIRFLEGWDTHNNCPGLGLMTKILNNSSSGLQELSLSLQWKESDRFIQQVLPHCKLASLKTFNLLENFPDKDKDLTTLVKAIVSRAPNLQVLYTECRVNLDANVLAGSSAVHVTDYTYCAIRNIPESVAGELKMKSISFEPVLNWEFSLERFSRITPVLLQNSCTVLHSLHTNAIFLVPFMRYAISLDNVKELRVFLDSKILQRFPAQFLEVIKNFDFTRILPRLVQVDVYNQSLDLPYPYPIEPSQDQINAMVEEWSGLLDEPKVDRAMNIKILTLSLDPPFDDISFSLLVHMVPHIEKLDVFSAALQDTPFALLWNPLWVNLKEIVLTVCGDDSTPNYANLDDVFCGIHPEEVAFLREQDEEYLRKVNIVSGPSISCLKDLSTLTLNYEDLSDSFKGPQDDPTYLFSKVTGLIAFNRCPALTVTVVLMQFNQRVKQDLRHLKPFVRIYG